MSYTLNLDNPNNPLKIYYNLPSTAVHEHDGSFFLPRIRTRMTNNTIKRHMRMLAGKYDLLVEVEVRLYIPHTNLFCFVCFAHTIYSRGRTHNCPPTIIIY
jgi:hypothetical protein